LLKKEDFTADSLRFFNGARPAQKCLLPDHLYNEGGTTRKRGSGDGDWETPNAKAIVVWFKRQGFDATAYLFDYWDEIFQADITSYLLLCLQLPCHSSSRCQNLPDTYELDKIIYILSNGAFASPNTTTASSHALVNWIILFLSYFGVSPLFF